MIPTTIVITTQRRNEIGYGLLKQVQKEIPSLLMNKYWVENNAQALGVEKEEAQAFAKEFASSDTDALPAKTKSVPPAKSKSEKSASLDPKIQVSVPDFKPHSPYFNVV